MTSRECVFKVFKFLWHFFVKAWLAFIKTESICSPFLCCNRIHKLVANNMRNTSVFHKSFTVVVLFSLGNKTLFCCSISAKRWKISSFFLQTCNLVSMEDLFSLIGQACDKIAHLLRESYYKRPYYVFNLDFLNFHYSWVKRKRTERIWHLIFFSTPIFNNVE